MNEEPRPTSILVADLSGSTTLYERLGNVAAHAVVSEVLGRWREIITRNGGRVVKTMGDGLLAVLPGPANAVRAAEALHRSLDEGAPGRAVRLTGRVALHTGPVLEQEGDVFGDAVNVAAHLAALAKPRQVLISGETVHLLPPTARGDVRSLGRTRVKGRASELELHEWIWEQDAVTFLVGQRMPVGALTTLVLTAGGVTTRLTPERPRVTIGRQPFNDLVVDDTRVSRLHARIELRGTRFVLCDVSSNGTYLCPFGGKAVVLHREEGDLGTMGFFGLGGEASPGEPHTVDYCVEPVPGDSSATPS